MLAQTAHIPIVEFYLALLVAIVFGLPAAINADRKPRKAIISGSAAVICALALLTYALYSSPDWRHTPVTGWDAVGYWTMFIVLYLGPSCFLEAIVLWRTRKRKGMAARESLKPPPEKQ